MCLRIFIPTARRLILFAVFALVPLLGLLDVIPPLKVFFGLPYILIFDYTTAIVAQIIYSYVLACIYAAAYVSIEANLRKNYPLMTYGAWKKRRKKPKRKKR